MAFTPPIRWNPVDCKVKLLDASNTVIDDDFDEPVSETEYDDEVEFEAQVKYTNKERRKATDAGDAPEADGWLTIKRATLDTIDITKGSIITEIDGVTTDYMIIEVRPIAPLKSASFTKKLLLVRLFFIKDYKTTPIL